MTIISVFLIAVGLALDAFAVAVACGLAVRPLRPLYAFRIAFFFGFFQFAMPVAGWAAGSALQAIIAAFDHWLAFILLVAAGGRMIYASFTKGEKSSCSAPVSTGALVILSLATSIDALAVGLSFAFLKEKILLPSLIIGAVTFALSFAGVWLGHRCGHIFENKLETAGGLILIGIAFKILVAHLAA
ncbi:MAG: manganese efflux pump MntP family protein [Kiritimatiellae bacterium]|nr:manganese efflux pump MntP family protein [Kiritimatiellia bacterium]